MLELGKESPVEVDGKTWILGRMELSIIRGFRDWIKAQIGDPFDKVERVLKFIDKDEALARIKAAEAIRDQLEGFSLQTPLAKEWMGSELGMTELIRLLLQKRHPGTTSEEAFQLLMAMGGQLTAETLQQAQGSVPNGVARSGADRPGRQASSTGTLSTVA